MPSIFDDFDDFNYGRKREDCIKNDFCVRCGRKCFGFDDVHYIRENIPDAAEANARSKTNFKLICLLVAGGITLAGATVVSAVF